MNARQRRKQRRQIDRFMAPARKALNLMRQSLEKDLITYKTIGLMSGVMIAGAESMGRK